jgi:hypothetical protein
VKPFPEAHELIGFFEAEPVVADPGVPWIYNSLTFRTTRGQDQVVCIIEPANLSVDIAWRRAERHIGTFRLRQVASLSLERRGATEIMKAEFRSRAIEPFSLHLKPHVEVTWGSADVT